MTNTRTCYLLPSNTRSLKNTELTWLASIGIGYLRYHILSLLPCLPFMSAIFLCLIDLYICTIYSYRVSLFPLICDLCNTFSRSISEFNMIYTICRVFIEAPFNLKDCRILSNKYNICCTKNIIIWGQQCLIQLAEFALLFFVTRDPFTNIPAWISNHMPGKVWDEITYPFTNFNGYTVDVWEGITYFIPHIMTDVITYPCWD